MRCDACKYWDEKEARDLDGLPLGLCTRAMPLWDATTWNKEGKRVLEPKFADRRFFAQDGSDYRADVYTATDFFCADFVHR